MNQRDITGADRTMHGYLRPINTNSLTREPNLADGGGVSGTRALTPTAQLDRRPDALQPAANRRSPRRFPWHLLAGVLLVITIVHHPILFSGFRLTQADLIDSRFNNNLLEHSFQWMTGNASFWNPAFCYPESNMLACSDLMISYAQPYWLARLIGFAPDTAFQLWMIAMTAINFLGAHLLLRRTLRVSRYPALAAATMFAIAGSRVAQLGHQQLYCQAYLLLTLYALLRYGTTGHIAWALTAGAALAAQFWGGFYMGFFFTLALFIGVACTFVIRRYEQRTISFRHGVKLSIAAVLFVLLVAPAAAHYRAVAEVASSPDTKVINAMLPTAKAWLYCGDSSVLYGRFDRYFVDLPVPPEQAMGLGLFTTIIAAIGLWSARRRPLVLVTLITGIAIILLTTRFGDHYSLWWIVRAVVPGASALRAVSRIGLLLIFPASLGFAIVLERLRTQRRKLIMLLVALLCVFEQLHHLPAYDKLQMRAEVARVTDAIPSNAQAFFFTGTDPNLWAMDQVDAMTASTQSDIPTLNGYTGTWPPEIRPLIMNDTPGNDAKVRQLLAAWIAANHLDANRVAWLVQTPNGVVRQSLSN